MGMMSLGRVMESMWLTADSLGTGFQVVSAFAGEGVRRKVKAIAGVPADMKMANAVQLGCPVRADRELRCSATFEPARTTTGTERVPTLGSFERDEADAEH